MAASSLTLTLPFEIFRVYVPLSLDGTALAINCAVYKILSFSLSQVTVPSGQSILRSENTFITSNPVSTIPDKMLEEFPMIERVNDFVSDNLYHYIYELYF